MYIYNQDKYLQPQIFKMIHLLKWYIIYLHALEPTFTTTQKTLPFAKKILQNFL